MRSVLRHYRLNLLIVFSALFIQGCGGGSGGGGRGASAAPPIRKPQVVVQVTEPNGTQSAVDTLYLAESGTQVLRKIANLGEHFSERHFSVSPGGKSLAYWSFDGANAPNIYSFWISNVDGSDKRLIHLSAFEPEFYWAPDGQSILYLADEGVDQVARLIKVADGQQVVLTAPGQRIEGFSWSNDSAHFAYGVHTLGSDHSVSTLNLTTDVMNHLLTTSDWIYLVSISQSGQYVAINTTGSVDRLYIVDTGQGQTTLFDNVFLYDFDWVPDRNIAYYVNGFSSILNLLDLSTLQSTPVKYGNGDDVLADEVFPSPDATQLFYNTYGLTNDVVGLVRVSDNYVQYSRQLTALDHPWGVVSWSPSGTKAAVGYTEFVSIVDALALNEAEITRADSTSLGGVSKIEWLSEEKIALQINDDIYVGERAKNNFQKAGEVNHSVDATFDLLPEGGALFYLSGASVNEVAPPAFSYYGLPVFYDVKAGRYDVLRLPNGDVPSASHFQVVK